MERNPNHPVTKEIRDNWYKFCALVMLKQGLKEIRFTGAELEKLLVPGNVNIVCRIKNEEIILSIVSDAEGERLAREEGGLPV